MILHLDQLFKNDISNTNTINNSSIDIKASLTNQLEYMVSECYYGGRVSDKYDSRLLNIII